MVQCPHCAQVLPKRLVLQAGWRKIQCPQCSSKLHPKLGLMRGIAFVLIIVWSSLFPIIIDPYQDTGNVFYLFLLIMIGTILFVFLLTMQLYLITFDPYGQEAIIAKKKAENLSKEYDYYCPRCLFQSNKKKKICPKCSSGSLERCK